VHKAFFSSTQRSLSARQSSLPLPCGATSSGNGWESQTRRGRQQATRASLLLPLSMAWVTDATRGCRLQSLKLSPPTPLPPHRKELPHLQPPRRQPRRGEGSRPYLHHSKREQSGFTSPQPNSSPIPSHSNHGAGEPALLHGSVAETQLKPTTSTGIRESQNSRGWKGPLGVTQSNLPVEAESPRAGCTGPCPGGS